MLEASRFMVLLIADFFYFGHVANPSVHDESGRMGGKDDLYIGIELADEVDELLLPVDVERDFGLVHEKGVWLSVLYQYSEEDGEHLLLSARKLVGCDNLCCIVHGLDELYLVALAVDFLVRVCKQFVDHVLKLLFGRTDLCCLLLVFRVSAGEQFDDAIPDVDLVVEETFLQTVNLPVKFSFYS